MRLTNFAFENTLGYRYLKTSYLFDCRTPRQSVMERVSESQMQKCMKRIELSAERHGDGATLEDPTSRSVSKERRLPWPEKRWCGRLPMDCGGGGEATMRAIRGYCRDQNLPDDMYRPVTGGCGGGGKFRLADLVDELHRVFAEDRVNVEYVQYLMESYRSDPAEWLKYAKFNKFRYTRNLVDAGNGKFNLMVLCWGEGNGSSIHDHPRSDCVMKILAGQLTEVRFAWPTASKSPTDDEAAAGRGRGDNDDDDDDDEVRPMYETSRTVLETDGICHINGSYIFIAYYVQWGD